MKSLKNLNPMNSKTISNKEHTMSRFFISIATLVLLFVVQVAPAFAAPKVVKIPELTTEYGPAKKGDGTVYTRGELRFETSRKSNWFGIFNGGSKPVTQHVMGDCPENADHGLSKATCPSNTNNPVATLTIPPQQMGFVYVDEACVQLDSVEFKEIGRWIYDLQICKFDEEKPPVVTPPSTGTPTTPETPNNPQTPSTPNNPPSVPNTPQQPVPPGGGDVPSDHVDTSTNIEINYGMNLKGEPALGCLTGLDISGFHMVAYKNGNDITVQPHDLTAFTVVPFAHGWYDDSAAPQDAFNKAQSNVGTAGADGQYSFDELKNIFNGTAMEGFAWHANWKGHDYYGKNLWPLEVINPELCTPRPTTTITKTVTITPTTPLTLTITPRLPDAPTTPSCTLTQETIDKTTARMSRNYNLRVVDQHIEYQKKGTDTWIAIPNCNPGTAAPISTTTALKLWNQTHDMRWLSILEQRLNTKDMVRLGVDAF